jgi:hypothetical protein
MRPPAPECVDCSTPHLAACDAQMERPFAGRKPCVESAEPHGPGPRVKPGAQSKQPPRDEARAPLARRTGVDLVAVTGLSASLAQTISAAVGTALRPYPTVQPCCAWLEWAPHPDCSGGRGLRARTLNVGSRATPAVRQAAQSVARSASAFGAYWRPLRARLGAQQAPVATAHQLARVLSHLLPYHQPFNEEAAADDRRKRRARDLQPLRRRPQNLAYTLPPGA